MCDVSFAIDGARLCLYCVGIGRHEEKPEPHPLAEAFTSIPGVHKYTAMSLPDDVLDGEFVEISTGEETPEALTNGWHRIIGVFFWLAWLGFGIYAWWQSGANLSEYQVAAVIWLLSFLFTIFGFPVMRRTARNRTHS